MTGCSTRSLADSMAQALSGIAKAYAMPGQKMRTGVVSVADETCAILAFGGALAALTHARTSGIGQNTFANDTARRSDDWWRPDPLRYRCRRR